MSTALSDFLALNLEGFSFVVTRQYPFVYPHYLMLCLMLGLRVRVELWGWMWMVSDPVRLWLPEEVSVART